MSTHQFARFGDAEASLFPVVPSNLRPWADLTYTDTTLTLTFTPDLTSAEVSTLSSLVGWCRAQPRGVSVAEWLGLQPDLAGLRTYQGIASPTLAQTVSAVKAQSRVLRAILRDG